MCYNFKKHGELLIKKVMWTSMVALILYEMVFPIVAIFLVMRHPYLLVRDVYGPPRFFRYGEGGRNKKKSNNRGGTQKDEGGVVDEQFRLRYK